MLTGLAVGLEGLERPIGRGHVPPPLVFEDQPRRVRRHDPVPPGERGRFLADFLALAVEPNLVEQEPDAAGRPQPGQEVAAVVLLGERLREGEPPLLARHGARERQGGPAGARRASQHDQLLPFEQVRQRCGMQLREPHVAFHRQFQVREHGAGDLAVEVRELEFQILSGQHVLARRPGRLHDPVEQVCVDVGADAEAEDPNRPLAGGFGHHVDELAHVGRAHRGQAVGEKDHEAGTVGVVIHGGELEAAGQGVGDGRAPDRLEALHEGHGLLAGGVVGRQEPVGESLGLGGEPDHAEPIAFVEVPQAELQRPPGLPELVALGHRAGGVEHEHDVLRLRCGRERRGRRGRKQGEGALVVARLPVAEQPEADLVGGLDAPGEQKVGVGPEVLGLEPDHGLPVAVPLHLDLVAGRVNRRERRVGLEPDRHAHRLERFRGKLLGVERIAILHEPTVGGEQLRVRQLHPLLFPRLEREDPHLEEILAGILQQRRVLHAAHDVLVDLPGLGGVEQLRFRELAVDVHREGVDLGPLGHREQIRALQLQVIGVEERLVDLGRGHLALDRHGHVMAAHFQRREGVGHVRGRPPAGGRPVDHDQTVGKGGGGSHQQGERKKLPQPTRNLLRHHGFRSPGKGDRRSNRPAPYREMP